MEPDDCLSTKSDLIDDDFGILSRANSIRHDNLEYLYNFDFYQDKAILQLMKTSSEYLKSNLITNLFIITQSDNFNGLIKILTILKNLELAKVFRAEDARNILYILDDYTKKNFHRYDAFLLGDVINCMQHFISYKNIDIALDWKIYYQMFLICYVMPKYELAGKYFEEFSKTFDMIAFIKSAEKFFIVSQDDYIYIKHESEKRIVDVDNSIGIGLLIAQLFLPGKLLSDDTAFQEKIFEIFINKPKYVNSVLCVFKKFIHIGIKINREIFIEKIFSLCYLLLTGTIDIFIFDFPSSLLKDSDIAKNLCYILAHILIHESFALYHSYAIKNFKICVRMINSFLTEDCASHSVNFAFKFIEMLFQNIKKIASFKTQYVLSEIHSMCEYCIKDEFKHSINEITTIMSPIISKCLFYNHSSSFTLFVEYISITDTDSLKQYMGILHYLFEKSEEDFDFFIAKVVYFARFLIENINDKEIEKLLLKVIAISINKISSLSQDVNAKILDFYNVVFILLIDKKKEMKEKYQTIVKIINEAGVLIFKKVLQLFSFFSDSGFFQNFLYIHHYFEFINADGKGIEYIKQIEGVLCDYLENNHMERNIEFMLFELLARYIHMHDRSFFTAKVWQMCYKNLIEIGDDSSSNTAVHCFKNINKERFIYFSNIISSCAGFFDYEDQTFTSQLIEYIKLSAKLPEERRKKFQTLMERVAVAILSPDVINLFHVKDGMTVTYPSQIKLKFACRIFKEIVTPNWMELHQNLTGIEDLCPEGMEIKKYYDKKSDFEKKSYEKHIDLFLELARSFLQNFENIFLTELPVANPIMSLMEQFTGYEIYQDIKKIIKSCEDLTMQLYTCSHRFGILKATGSSFCQTFPSRIFDTCTENSRTYLTSAVKFILAYNELRYNEAYFVKSQFLRVTFQKQMHMLYIQESSGTRLMDITKPLIKAVLKNSNHIEASLVKGFENVITLFEPESSETFRYIDETISYLEEKIEKIDISQEVSNEKLVKFFNCGTLIICFITYYMLKFYDLSYSFEKLNKLRIISSKHNLFESLFENIYDAYTSGNYKQIKANGLYIDCVDSLFPKDTFNIKVMSLEELYDIIAQSSSSETLLQNQEAIKKVISMEYQHQENLRISSDEKIRMLICKMLDQDLSLSSSDYLDSIFIDVDFITMFKLVLDVKNPKDKIILEAIEENYLYKFFEGEEEDMFKRRVFYIAVTIIEQLKFKNSKLYSNEKGTTVDAISMSRKKNFPCDYRDKKYSKDPTSDKISQYFIQVTSGISLSTFITHIYSLQDQKDNYFSTSDSNQTLTRLEAVETTLFYLIFPHKRSSFLDSNSKCHTYNLTDTPVLWDRKLTKFLFYAFYRSQFKDYDLLFRNFKAQKEESGKDKLNEVAFVGTLVLFLYAMIKNDLIACPSEDQYSKIKQALTTLMGYYTYNINKRVDSEILTFFSYIIELVSPDTAMKLLYDTESDCLFIFNYDIHFLSAMCGILHDRFLFRIIWIFSQGRSLSKMKEIFEQMMSTHVDWVKNESSLNKLFLLYPILAGIEEYDYLMLTTKFNIQEMLKEFANIRQIYRKEKSKESRNLIGMFISSKFDYFINHDIQSFLALLAEFSYEKELTTNVFENEMNNILLKVKDYHYKELTTMSFVELILSTMTHVKNEESNSFLTELFTYIVIPRIHQLAEDYSFFFQKIPKYIQYISNKSTKEYMCEAFSCIFFSMEEDTIQAFAQEIDSLIYSEFEKGNKDNSISLIMLLNTFLVNFDLKLTKSTEMILINLDKINLRLFRNKGEGSHTIKKIVTKFYEKYSTTYQYVKRGLSLECQYAIDNLSKFYYYFS